MRNSQAKKIINQHNHIKTEILKVIEKLNKANDPNLDDCIEHLENAERLVCSSRDKFNTEQIGVNNLFDLSS